MNSQQKLDDYQLCIRALSDRIVEAQTPIRVLDSMKDWEWIAECWCYAFWGFGVRPADRVFFAFSYGSFVGFHGHSVPLVRLPSQAPSGATPGMYCSGVSMTPRVITSFGASCQA